MLVRKNALILVADGEKFLLLRNAGDVRKPVLVFEGSGEQENPATQEQGTDEPGRFPGVGRARSAAEQTDFHHLAEVRFAGDIAAHLASLAAADDFAELIVVAPPRTLAELRKRFAPAVANRIIAEVTKDLTNHPVNAIAAILERWT